MPNASRRGSERGFWQARETAEIHVRFGQGGGKRLQVKGVARPIFPNMALTARRNLRQRTNFGDGNPGIRRLVILAIVGEQYGAACAEGGGQAGSGGVLRNRDQRRVIK